jgi:antirestriction protein ArdC
MSADRAETLHRQLLERVGELRSSKEWLEAMMTAARFHDYSFGNWVLLWSQAEARDTQITRPAGYRAWQRMGRQVRRGERGYQVLAPVTRRAKRNDKDDDDGSRVLVGFRVATVFDIAQTDGEPLPDAGPRLLNGEADAPVVDAAIGMIEAQGFTFTLGELRGPNGVTRPVTREVVVDGRLEGAQITKTTVHELAHVLLHSDSETIDCRGQLEVEAESVAYVVCGAAGLDTSSYSVAYVAGWAETTDDPSRILLATGERIVAASRRILDHIAGRSPSDWPKSSHSASSPFLVASASDKVRDNSSEPLITAANEVR